eukprot:756092-Hanusia_phi.AAC.3
MAGGESREEMPRMGHEEGVEEARQVEIRYGSGDERKTSSEREGESRGAGKMCKRKGRTTRETMDLTEGTLLEYYSAATLAQHG